MDKHRLVDPTDVKVICFDPPKFSSFDHVDKFYNGEYPAIRRLFSLARSHPAHTLMIENISPTGIIEDENKEIKQYVADYKLNGLQRISFWTSNFTIPDANVCRGENCVGYAILKHDKSSSKKYNEWHVFEAVFKKFQHEHNCVPNPMEYKVCLGGTRICLKGLLYAQQNKLNKTCAQVALRSVISRIIHGDVSYRQINELAKGKSTAEFNPANGLDTQQIRAVLQGFGIRFRDFDYTQYKESENVRDLHPYRKFVYLGIESGAGALVGFRLSGPGTQSNERHIIPFYGHTFNKDTWVPEADIAYFRVGANLGYVPSESWTSSFLGHDDNFGPNFCIPRLYIRPDQVEYVVELLKPGVVFSGAQAEALSISLLYSVLNQIDPSKNVWLKRLIYYAQPGIQRIVLRAIALERDKYIKHLSNGKDWHDRSEHPEVIDILRRYLPESLWIVEISIPQLFPANERKLGEIVLNGEHPIEVEKDNHSNFLFARLPGFYFFEWPETQKKQNFLQVPSNFTSHLSVIKLD